MKYSLRELPTGCSGADGLFCDVMFAEWACSATGGGWVLDIEHSRLVPARGVEISQQ
jgi:hypothetical protein